MKAYQFGSVICHPTRHAVMDNENSSSNIRNPRMRITRARSKGLCSSGLPPLYPSAKQNNHQTKTKRAASDYDKSDSNSDAFPPPPHKKRAVFKDVTNITCKNLYTNCINATREQPIKQERTCSLQSNGKVAPSCFMKEFQAARDKRGNIMENLKVQVEESQALSLAIEPIKFISAETLGLVPLATNSKGDKLSGEEEKVDCETIIDVDSKHKDPQMCSVYAFDIYLNLRGAEFDRRPSIDYMEKLQKDISERMRGILVDWLVEVSEEYRLVPDTLYLTVNLIDRFLSKDYVKKQNLQLVGVACMLVASKYEELCAPHVEEFCFITDNTYTKEEVVKMESRILNFLGFQLSAPTTKKFLRRFVQVAQVSYKVPSVELEYLANYLAELTLIEYSFLKCLPSLIAASAVFLARWTLDQSAHPWNPTLEHYTRYTTSGLKITVFELQDLQLNTSLSTLNAIRQKYKQSKFKRVSTLRAQKPVQSLF